MTSVHSSESLYERRLEDDPDILALCRVGGSDAGALNTESAALETIRLTAEEENRRTTSPTDHQSALAAETLPARSGLQVRFFGDFEVHQNGSVLPPCRSVKAQTILKYLLSHPGQAVSRDFLMGWLWPEANLKKARWSLNSSVYALRRFLDDHLSVENASELVMCAGGHYHLRPTLRVRSDVEDFDERYARGCRLMASGRVSDAMAEYEESAKLYRGDYLVEDLYEDWTMVERERLTGAYVNMLDQLADHYAKTDRHQRAIEVCYEILKKDPGFEHNHRRLIGCYARLGLRELALRHYQICQNILVNRYGIDPSADTQVAYKSILIEDIDCRTY